MKDFDLYVVAWSLTFIVVDITLNNGNILVRVFNVVIEVLQKVI